mmetsp:Transcript_85279/g.217249  ORF Transcript_85279/g.217249 Transcript_85279/m.217249 type:complete len:264 (-) Transcript_85279:270-1061(-)
MGPSSLAKTPERAPAPVAQCPRSTVAQPNRACSHPDLQGGCGHSLAPTIARCTAMLWSSRNHSSRRSQTAHAQARRWRCLSIRWDRCHTRQTSPPAEPAYRRHTCSARDPATRPPEGCRALPPCFPRSSRCRSRPRCCRSPPAPAGRRSPAPSRGACGRPRAPASSYPATLGRAGTGPSKILPKRCAASPAAQGSARRALRCLRCSRVGGTTKTSRRLRPPATRPRPPRHASPPNLPSACGSRAQRGVSSDQRPSQPEPPAEW